MSSRQVKAAPRASTVTGRRPDIGQRQLAVLPPTSTIITVIEALDRAFAGEPCEVVLSDGTSKTMPVARWKSAPSPADLALFVDQCTGPTLDVGCRPGRLSAALTERGVHALGIGNQLDLGVRHRRHRHHRRAGSRSRTAGGGGTTP